MSTGTGVWSQAGRGYIYESAVSFSWQEYLKAEGSKPAPACCFRQAEQPPVNEFDPPMKLESQDPRNPESMCIATVIERRGPRVRLRLDGGDNSNDFWSLVDSSDIRPIGWTNRHGQLLQPPLGFVKSASTWPSFLTKMLTTGIMAPESCFKPEPPKPKENFFEVNMKLEAVDRKHPHLICPATVAAVDCEKIFVRFDGWGEIGYWAHFSSRDLFPVGWCAKAGHPLQPPGQKGAATQSKQETTSKGNSTTLAKATADTYAAPGAESHSAKAESHSASEPINQETRKKSGFSLASAPEMRVSTTVSTPNSDQPRIRLYVNRDCFCGPHIDSNQLANITEGCVNGQIMEALTAVIQMLVNCSSEPDQFMNKLVTGQSRHVITARVKDPSQSVDARVTQTCRLPLLSEQTEVGVYLSKLLSSLKCCANLVLFKPLNRPCPCKVGRGTVSSGKRSSSSPLSVQPSKRGRPRKVQSASVSPTSGQDNGDSCDATPPLQPPVLQPMQPPVLSAVSTPSSLQESGWLRRGTQLPTHADSSMLSSDPNTWTCEDVMGYVGSMDESLKPYVGLMKHHEIDGRAFMLLNSDIVIKYMNLKLGPALKMCDLIDRLKLLRDTL